MTVFISQMVNSLQVIGQSLGYNPNSAQQDINFLTNLVWSGSLEDTQAFVDTFDFNQQQQIPTLDYQS